MLDKKQEPEMASNHDEVSSVISFIKSTSNLEEFVAGESGILPGHLITMSAGECIRNVSNEEDITAFVAMENIPAGKCFVDPYEIGEIVFCRRLRTGDVVYLRFGSSSQQSVIVGDPVGLVSGSVYPGNISAGIWHHHIGISLEDCICGPGEELPLLVQIKFL